MTQDVATLKAEITSALDSLPPESLRLLREFVAFLRSRGEEPVPQGRIVKTPCTSRGGSHAAELPGMGAQPAIFEY